MFPLILEGIPLFRNGWHIEGFLKHYIPADFVSGTKKSGRGIFHPYAIKTALSGFGFNRILKVVN
jgi:hypothetical protein